MCTNFEFSLNEFHLHFEGSSRTLFDASERRQKKDKAEFKVNYSLDINYSFCYNFIEARAFKEYIVLLAHLKST
jgi:hypothetical protein